MEQTKKRLIMIGLAIFVIAGLWLYFRTSATKSAGSSNSALPDEPSAQPAESYTYEIAGENMPGLRENGNPKTCVPKVDFDARVKTQIGLIRQNEGWMLVIERMRKEETWNTVFGYDREKALYHNARAHVATLFYHGDCSNAVAAPQTPQQLQQQIQAQLPSAAQNFIRIF